MSLFVNVVVDVVVVVDAVFLLVRVVSVYRFN